MQELLKQQIALSLIPKVGPVLAKNLVSYCGSVEAIFKEKKSKLLKIPYVGEAVVHSLKNADIFERAEKEVQFIESHNITAHFYLDEQYPSRLKHYNDAPILLYYKGTDVLDSMRTLGIVGTRKPSDHGKATCERIVDGLKDANVSIISGLAYGIDTTAHSRCTIHNIPTVGVLGHGLDKLYPQSNINLARKMGLNGGILTEFISGTNPDAINFPQRNRVIAMLSDAVLVVESAEKGGSMISADFAFQYNKDVFAIPGRPSDTMSKGTNKLIKENKAALVESSDDINAAMNWDVNSSSQQTQMNLAFDLTDDEKTIVSLIKKEETLEIDKLHYLTKISHSSLSSTLLNLEFKGVIKSLPGKKYILS